MRRVIFNQKGGVGKSSIAVNLAALSAEQDLKTLLVDLDAQCNASQYVLGEDYEVEADAADFFEQFLSFRLLSRDLAAFITSTPFRNLDVLPASPRLRELESRLESKYKIYKLRDALDVLEETYDAIYIDTPPALNFYTLSALIAADTCLIPFDCDEFARHALYGLLDNVRELRADHNDRLEVEGIIVNLFDARANLPKRIVQELRDEELPVLDTILPASVKMRESHERSTPLVYFAPKHKLTERFSDLYNELHRHF